VKQRVINFFSEHTSDILVGVIVFLLTGFLFNTVMPTLDRMNSEPFNVRSTELESYIANGDKFPKNTSVIIPLTVQNTRGEIKSIEEKWYGYSDCSLPDRGKDGVERDINYNIRLNRIANGTAEPYGETIDFGPTDSFNSTKIIESGFVTPSKPGNCTLRLKVEPISGKNSTVKYDIEVANISFDTPLTLNSGFSIIS
jgi:hypothetical protein